MNIFYLLLTTALYLFLPVAVTSFELKPLQCAVKFLDWAKQPMEIFLFNAMATNANKREALMKDLTTEFQAQPHHVSINKMHFDFLDRRYEMSGKILDDA